MASENELKELNKKQLVAMVIELKSENANLRDLSIKLKDIDEKISKIQSDLEISRNVSNLLQEKVICLERKLADQSQYSRRECLEVSGIPVSVTDVNLEEKVLSIFKKIDCEVSNKDIESCHRIGNKKGTTIVKLSRRKDVKKILSNKKLLKEDVNMASLNLSEDCKLYINESLCPEYRNLWHKCRKLWKRNEISSFWTVNGVVRIKKSSLENVLLITHICDLEMLFPHIDFQNL